MVTKTKKVFVGGLSATSTVDDVKGYFKQFGKVFNNLLYIVDKVRHQSDKLDTRFRLDFKQMNLGLGRILKCYVFTTKVPRF